MRNAPRIPEIGQRDRFIRRAVIDGAVYTIAADSLQMPSRRFPGCHVQLFWSTPIEAKRWATALTGLEETREIPLSEFTGTILPALAAQKAMAGVDWIADPVEAEVAPEDLALRLKTEAVGPLVSAIACAREIWSLEDDKGPVLETSLRRSDKLAFHIWQSKDAAERQALRKGGVPRVVSDPLDDFMRAVIPWLGERGYLLGLEPIDGSGVLEIEVDDFARRLMAAGHPA